MEEMKFDDIKTSDIAKWYAGKNIFITGSTGFMGKVLVEKLLRNCPDVKTLYLLIRSKKGDDYIDRKKNFLKCSIFKKILEENCDLENKIRIFKGDVLEDKLGLSDNDYNELALNVDVIFHCAANVRFDQSLRPILLMNVSGTLKILQLAEQMENLKVIVHVSTSYCQCNESVLEERAYPASHEPLGILEMINKLDDNALEKLTPSLLSGLPNTYAYSKALTEALICTYGDKLPIVVCRPSIVTASKKEPIPGWIEGVNGPTGLMIGAARGVIRSMHCNPDYPATVIPVDTAINAIIIAGWDRALTKSNKVEFCNVCLSSKALFSWGESIEAGKRFFYDYPLSFALWYPDGSIKKNYYHHLFCIIFFHYLPAYIIDFLLLIVGKKPFLIRVQKKVSTGLKLLQYYTTRSWDFRNDRFQQLNSKLNSLDQELFDISVDQINWEDYIRNYIIGMRTFMLGESTETIPRAKRLLRRLYIIDRITTLAFYASVFTFLWMHMDNMVERGDAFLQSSVNMIFSDYDNDTIPQ